jgi:hypothetical protein
MSANCSVLMRCFRELIMNKMSFARILSLVGFTVIVAVCLRLSLAEDLQHMPRAFVDGTGPGWRSPGEQDFTNVNGLPIGVMRTRQLFTNFELVAEWRHLRSAGEGVDPDFLGLS